MRRLSYALWVGLCVSVVVSSAHAATYSIYRQDNVLVGANFNDGPGSSDMTLIMRIDSDEAVLIRFERDVIIESAAIVAGKNGACGGFYRVGDAAPLAIYCIDADIDANDQSGILSDIGVLKAGRTLRLDSSPHYGVESPGQWRLATLKVRVLE